MYLPNNMSQSLYDLKDTLCPVPLTLNDCAAPQSINLFNMFLVICAGLVLPICEKRCSYQRQIKNMFKKVKLYKHLQPLYKLYNNITMFLHQFISQLHFIILINIGLSIFIISVFLLIICNCISL